MPNVSQTRRNRGVWLVSCALALVAAVGCKPDQSAQKSQHAAPSAEPASPQRLAEIRQKYVAQNPGTIVGPVVDAMPEVQLVAVDDVPLDQFHVGDVVVFINNDEQKVDTGVVFDIKPHILVLKYDRLSTRGRAPQVGDLMVHLPPLTSTTSP